MGLKGDLELRALAADLHIHTCLSPCATLDMTPRKILDAALKKHLALIAVTDHNSAENTTAMVDAARGTDLCVLPGIEITTSEEAHIVGLFQDVDAAASMQALVYEHLQPGENDEDLFGLQVVTNALEEVEGINTRLLIGATALAVHQVVAAIQELGGLAVAAHIDRQSFSVLSQLGFIPEDLVFDALEISRRMSLAQARKQFREYSGSPFITASDAHSLEDIGTSPTLLRVAHPDLIELKLALTGQEGRMVLEGVGLDDDGRPFIAHTGSC